MKRKTFWWFAGLFAVLLVVLPACEAYAVVPAVVGPIQALVAILPQLLAMLVAAIVALTKPDTYKGLFKFLWHQKILSLCIVAGCVLLVWGGRKLFGGSVAEEQSGAAWTAQRGGPSRTGAMPGAGGPMDAAKVLWSYAEKKRERVDSSPAVVGNRIYTSSAVLSLFVGRKITGSGTIYCRDAAGGGVVWAYSGEGMGDSLTSVFSSPAVGGEFEGQGQDGRPEEGRYLVVGEGYHQDMNSRFFCLDLDPVKKGGRKPALKWFKQATSHVESSPCIHKCVDDKYRIYVGAGDDGIWSVELESGELAWMVEGTAAYYLHAECPDIEKVRALAGKTVAVKCTVERFGGTVTDPGQVLVTGIDPGGISEVADPGSVPVNAGKGFKRTIVGRVAVGEVPGVEGDTPGSRRTLKEASGVRIEIPRYYADVESAPIAVDLPEDPAVREGRQQTLVFFGCGLKIKHENFGIEAPVAVSAGARVPGTSGVACVDGVTGEEKWFYPVKDPVFSAPTVVRNVKVKDRVTDVVIVGYGKGDFVNVAANPKGYILCLDVHDVTDGAPKKLWEVETGDTILGAVAVWTKDLTAYACARDGSLYVVNILEAVENPQAAKAKKIPLGTSLVCAPVVTKGAVYAVSLHGMAYCVDRLNLSLRWKLSITPCGDMFGSPVAAGGKVYVGTPGQGLFCLGADTAGAGRAAKLCGGPGGGADRGGAADNLGLPTVEAEVARRKWRGFRFRGRTVEGPLAACGGALYMSLETDGGIRLAGVDAARGSEKWSKNLGGPITALAAAGDRVYALVGENGREQNLVCLDAADGARKWKTPALYVKEMLSLAGDRLTVVKSKGPELVCLSAGENGAELWKRELPEISGAPAMTQGLVIVAVGGEKPRLVCLEDGLGREVWSSLLPGPPVGPPACASERVIPGPLASTSGKVVVGCLAGRRGAEADVKGYLVCVRLRNGKRLWKAKLPAAPVAYPVIDESYAVVAAADGKLYAFEAMPGRLPAEPKPAVLRGGSWASRPGECRSAMRGNEDPTNRSSHGGLRVLMVLPSGAESPPPPKEAEWPFDAQEAKRRQQQTARKLGVPVERTVDLGGGVKLELVLIPAGEFVMGGRYGPEEIRRRGGGDINLWRREHPRHKVRITKPYCLGKYEVTQAQWERVMGRNPAKFKAGRNPVEQVSRDDCQKFIGKLNETFKGKLTFRLPTEAEWEGACRAGTDTSFHFGEKITTDQANYNGNRPWDEKKGTARKKTTEVGSFAANAWGLHDMAGNVWEWCEDGYGPYAEEDQTDPQEPDPLPEVDETLTGEARKKAEAAREAKVKAYAEHRKRNHHRAMVKWDKQARKEAAEKVFEARAVRAEGMSVGRDVQAPALVGGVVVYGGYKRLATWNLAANTWPWRFRDQGLMGKVLAPPVVMGETVFVVTEKRGLMAVGEHEVVKFLTRLQGVEVIRGAARLAADRFHTVEDLKAASLEDLQKVLGGKYPGLAGQIYEELLKKSKEAAK